MYSILMGICFFFEFELLHIFNQEYYLRTGAYWTWELERNMSHWAVKKKKNSCGVLDQSINIVIQSFRIRANTKIEFFYFKNFRKNCNITYLADCGCGNIVLI